MKIFVVFAWITASALAVCVPMSAQQLPQSDRVLAREIFRELIEINTTHDTGNVTAAATAVRARLLAAGFAASDVQLLGPAEKRQNLVVRLHGRAGSTLKPVLVICHLDVVEAKREDWTTDPFVFTEKDSHFYGRGAIDMKDSDAAVVETFLRMKREGYVPNRDVVLALTADEEGGADNGVEWLVANHRELVDAEFVINPDSGGVATQNGKALTLGVEATEKTYADYVVTATSAGGHSSEPMPGNPIYRVAAALARLEKYKFAFELNTVTRGYFEAVVARKDGQRAVDIRGILKTPPSPAAIANLDADPAVYPQLHTTCVATMMTAGHAPNALPARAEANVNCRILPGHTQEEVRRELIRVFADAELKVQYADEGRNLSETAPDHGSAPPPALNPLVMTSLKKVAGRLWPGTQIVPIMEAGASDSVYTTAAGMPSYGVNGMAMERDENRAHGRDERIGVEDFYTGTEFFYEFLREMTS